MPLYAATPQVILGNEIVPERMSVTLTCNVRAVPVATFAEIVRLCGEERVQLVNDTNERMLTTLSVMYSFIPIFSDDDGAHFQCLSINDYGVATDNSTLTVQGRLYIYV